RQPPPAGAISGIGRGPRDASCRILPRHTQHWNPLSTTFHTVCLIFATARTSGRPCGDARTLATHFPVEFDSGDSQIALQAAAVLEGAIKLASSGLLAVAAVAIAGLIGSSQGLAQ